MTHPWYERLRSNYPNKPRHELYAGLGGQWPDLVDHPNYQNTCAIRLSVAFHAAGKPIPAAFKEGIAGDGRALIIKVRTMWRFMNEEFGGPTWGMSKQPGTPVKIPPAQGIVVYHAAFSDATGHFDLWTGTRFVGSGSMGDVSDGFDVAIWY